MKMTDLTIPCGYLDDDRLWDEPELIDLEEDSDPRTELEKRISWICSEWADALNDDTSDVWRDMSLMIAGAIQSLIYCDNRLADIATLRELQTIANCNVIECIVNNRYEGAPK